MDVTIHVGLAHLTTTAPSCGICHNNCSLSNHHEEAHESNKLTAIDPMNVNILASTQPLTTTYNEPIEMGMFPTLINTESTQSPYKPSPHDAV